MIFENKRINLPNGEDFMFYPISEKEFIVYYKNKVLKKKKMIVDKIVRFETQKFDVDCDFVCQISNEHICKCIDGNISVVDVE